MTDEEKYLRECEVGLDNYHRGLALYGHERPQALYALHAAFDCLAIVLPLLDGPDDFAKLQYLKSFEEGLVHAVRWLTDGAGSDVEPVASKDLIEQAYEFLKHGKDYAHVADFHRMYGRGQVTLETDRHLHKIRFVPVPGKDPAGPLGGLAEDAATRARDLQRGMMRAARLAEAAHTDIARVKHHPENGRIVLDEFDFLNVDRAVSQFAIASRSRGEHYLEPSTSLDGFTLLDFEKWWTALLAWSHAVIIIFVNRVMNHESEQWEAAPTQVVPRATFIEAISSASGLGIEIVQTILQRLTYDKRTASPDIWLQPLLCTPETVAWSPRVVIGSRYVRNLLRLMARDPKFKKLADNVIGSRSRLMLRELGQQLAKFGYSYKLNTDIRTASSSGEVDLLAYKSKHADQVLLVEAKAILAADEINEVAAATAELAKGQLQLASAERILKAMPDKEKAAAFRFVDWQTVRSFCGIVVTPETEPDDTLDRATFPAISFEAMRLRLRGRDWERPERIWRACRDRKWLEYFSEVPVSYSAIGVGDTTYELPSIDSSRPPE